MDGEGLRAEPDGLRWGSAVEFNAYGEIVTWLPEDLGDHVFLSKVITSSYYVVAMCYNIYRLKVRLAVNEADMDKNTRILLLYSKLARGDSVSKAAFCMETDSNGRTFDRDIEDLRLFLSETFSTEEIIYDRLRNCYYLSGVMRQDIEMTEYRFIERVLTQSKILRKDELIGVLSILASNTSRPKESIRSIEDKVAHYENENTVPLLKIHDDLSQAIACKLCIKIKYHNNRKEVCEYKIIPCDIQFVYGKMFLISVEKIDEDYKIQFFLVDRIESFEKIGTLSSKEWMIAYGYHQMHFNQSDLMEQCRKMGLYNRRERRKNGKKS